MYEEFDVLMSNLKEKQEMEDFINKNIYPENLKSSCPSTSLNLKSAFGSTETK